MTWTKFWMYVVTVACWGLIVLLATLSVGDKSVRGYYLTGSAMEGVEIGVDIDNAIDHYIPLIGVTYEQAVAIVNELNAGLPKKDGAEGL